MSAEGYAVAEARALMQTITAERLSAAFSGRCDFCGARTYGRACPSHTDLLLIEQAAMRFVPESNETAAPFHPGSAAVSPTEGA